MEQAISAAEDGIATNWEQLSKAVKVQRRTLQSWAKEYPDLGSRLFIALNWHEPRADGLEVPDFATFRRVYFGHETHSHQSEWIDHVQANDLSLILVPPEHAKTMTMSIEYPTWRIVKDRNVRVISVSKTQVMARKILMAVKKRLTDHTWYEANGTRSVVADFGPFEPGAREKNRLPWAADMFYVSGTDSAEKDPTMEALGMGGQIYGARADLIILDDVATLKNQQSEVEREKQLEWLAQEVMTRLSEDGKLIIVGTRVLEWDIYGTLLNRDIEWVEDFAAIARPAILDEEAQTTLWPEYWPYEKLVTKRRNRMPLRQWNLVYQQQATGMPDAPFALDALEQSKDKEWPQGKVPPGRVVVMGVDPALEGTLAVCVVALDRATGERMLVDCIARRAVRHPEVVKQTIVEAASKYGAVRCRIEKNAMQGFLSKDVDLIRRLAAVGCKLEEEHTHASNKYDPEWGVSSVAAQFDQGIWTIPCAGSGEAYFRPLVEELAAWRPVLGRKGIQQDRVMALWLAELAARQIGSFRPGLPRTWTNVPSWARRQAVPSWVGG